jgi:hypothetical protein
LATLVRIWLGPLQPFWLFLNQQGIDRSSNPSPFPCHIER